MRRSGVSLIGIALALAMVFSSRAYCDPLLTFEVFDPDRLNLPGSVYMFDGQITNNTGTPLRATDLFLNFFGFDPTVITANQLLGFPDFTIPDGGTSPVVPLFTLDFGSSADPTQVYLANLFLQDFTGSFFSPPVTVTIGPVPEPRGLWLLGLMLSIFLILRRRSSASERILKRRDSTRMGVFLFFPLISLLIVALPALRGQTSFVSFSTGVTGQALISSDTLELEVPLINEGNSTASDVQVTDVALRGAPLQEPSSFPVSLGDMAPGNIVNLYASFDRSSLTTGGRYLLTARGQYTLDGAVLGFTVNQFITLLAANTLTGDTVAQRASDSPAISDVYPPDSFLPDLDEANPFGPDLPTGPPRPGPVNDDISVDESEGHPLAAPAGADPGVVTILRNTAFRDAVTARFSTEVNDPSGASDGTLVLVTGNAYALFSRDAGRTFSYIDPTTVFPNDDNNKLCCDQVVLYAPQVGRFFWLMEYAPKNGVNLLRLATATAADIAAQGPTARGVWVYYDLTSAALGLGSRWMDFNDLAIGNNHLYISTNLIDDNARPSKVVGSVLVRYPLADLGGQAVRDWSVEMGFSTVRAVQNSGDTGFFVAHASSSEVQLWRQPENSLKVYQRKIEIPSWPHIYGDFDSFTPPPNRTNWLAFLKDLRDVGYAITGSTRSDNQLWLAWTAAKGSILSNDSPPQTIQIPQPHIEAVTVVVGSFKVPRRIVLFSRDYAYAYPALATNGDGEIGISLAYGGNTAQPNHAVGFLSDPVRLKKTTSSTSASTRWGDYMSIRPEPDSGVFSATGHGWTGSPDPHYVRFGRAGAAGPQ